ncbi:MAG: DUF1460 domain-containing protein [Ignavibacteria bacterium]|nr:DUF1460 domain-containing protein [Ignavibacteria bacterium]
MDRRNFIGLLAAPLFLQQLKRSRKKNTDKQATTKFIYSQAMKRAHNEHWEKLPIGELMGNLGMLLLGTPYVGGTLEGDGPEVCRIDLTGLDCVTYFENVLCMARVAKKHKHTIQDFYNEVIFTRYRQGEIAGYTSRLHYTSDWISDNEAKHVVTDITPQLGGIPFPNRVSFMSANPKYYAPLVSDPALVNEIISIEQRLNSTPRTYIPKDKIADCEGALQTGDIIAIATSKAGLDYAHTGIIYKSNDGIAHLLHASLTKKKVILDVSISDYVKGVKSHTGITVVRPAEV